MKALSTIIGSLVAVGAMAYSTPSHAATAYRIAINHATASCMGSLPVDRDMTRARPEGMTNVAAGLSDVKCGGTATPLSNYSDVELFEVALQNDSASDIEINCMLSDGLGENITGVTINYPKTITIAAGQSEWIDWDTNDTGGGNFSYPSLSCQLPIDVSISYTLVMYQEDIGL
jgi:hypothetical protein